MRLALVLIGLLLAPASAHAACERDRDGGLVAKVLTAPGVTRVVVCDPRTGRARTVRRAKGISRGERRSGARIEDVAADGRSVAWVESRSGGSRPSASVVRADARGRVLSRDRFALPSAGRFDRADLAVVLTRDGTVAWVAPAAPRSNRVRLRRSGRAGQDTAIRGIRDLRVEDRRTLRGDGGEDFDYLDVGRPAVTGGCPSRSRFRPTVTTAEHVVSVARYPGEEDGSPRVVTRVCLRGRAVDPVVLQSGDGGFGVSDYGGVLALAGEWVVLLSVSDDSRYQQCSGSAFALRLTDGHRGRSFSTQNCEELPSPSVALTASGAFAWRVDGDRILAAATGPPEELDRGPAGSLTDPVAGPGEAFTWRHDGRPRSAPPP